MNLSDRKIPRVGLLFQQRSSYEAHLKNLSQIKNRGRALSGPSIQKNDSCGIIRQRQYSQGKKWQINQFKINHQNRRLASKLCEIKGSIKFRQKSLLPCSASRSNKSSVNSHFRLKENNRIKCKLRELHSDISSKNLERDYTRAKQIKQRLMRYSTDHNQRKVILKAQKILVYAKNRSDIITSRVQIQKKAIFPQINKIKSLKKQLILIKQQPVTQLIRSSRRQKIKQKLQPKSKTSHTVEGGLHTLLQKHKSYNKQSRPTFCTDITVHKDS